MPKEELFGIYWYENKKVYRVVKKDVDIYYDDDHNIVKIKDPRKLQTIQVRDKNGILKSPW